MIFLKIRPYVEPVKQCYNCFRFGHLKAFCRSNKRYIICADYEHGECDKEVRCRNCNGNHKSNFKKCPLMEYNKNIKVIMAYNNCSYESVRIMEDKENTGSHEYDRYTHP